MHLQPDEDHYRTDFHFIVFMTINGLLVELVGVSLMCGIRYSHRS